MTNLPYGKTCNFRMFYSPWTMELENKIEFNFESSETYSSPRRFNGHGLGRLALYYDLNRTFIAIFDYKWSTSSV